MTYGKFLTVPHSFENNNFPIFARKIRTFYCVLHSNARRHLTVYDRVAEPFIATLSIDPRDRHLPARDAPATCCRLNGFVYDMQVVKK
jgi:hypothetical protein